MTTLRLPVLALLCLAACSPGSTSEVATSGAANTAAITTDEPSYRFELDDGMQRLDVEYAFENRSGRAAHVARCGSTAVQFRLEKQVGGAWVPAFDPICPLILVEPYVVPAGEVLEGEIVIDLVPGAEPRLQVAEVPGTYRLLLSIHDGWDPDPGELGPLLPVEVRATEPFTIEG